MTSDELRDRIEAMGLTQNGLARVIGVNERSVRRWCAGQNDIPEALAERMDEITDEEIEDAMMGVR